MSVQSEFVNKLKAVTAEKKAKSIVVASKGGKSALQLAGELGKEVTVIAVSEFTYSDSVKKDMKKGKVTAVENANLPIQDIREMRETLMMFDTGIKAALEVASIAALNHLVDGTYIAVAGSGNGLNTALVLNTVHPNAESISEPIKQLKVERILASPLIE